MKDRPEGPGVRAAPAGVLCAAAMMSTAGRVLSEKIDVLQLAFYTAPVSSCVLLPFFWFLEVRKRPSRSIKEAEQTFHGWLRVHLNTRHQTLQRPTRYAFMPLKSGKSGQGQWGCGCYESHSAACAEGQVPCLRPREWRSRRFHRASWVDCGTGVQRGAQHAPQADIFCGGAPARRYQTMTSALECCRCLGLPATMACNGENRHAPAGLQRTSTPSAVLPQRSARTGVAVHDAASGQASEAARHASRYVRLPLHSPQCRQPY